MNEINNDTPKFMPVVALRDYFAAVALQGVVGPCAEFDKDRWARFSYDIADAMFRAGWKQE